MTKTETLPRGILRDRPDRYGLVSRLFHWLLAAMICWQLLGMILKVTLGRVPVAGFFVSHHQQLGSVIFCLVALRLGWALLNRGHRPGHGAGLAGMAARLGQGALYLVMAAVPTIAVLRAWGGTRGFAPFGFEIFAPREVAIGWTRALGELHGPLGWALLVLIGGHVAMALLHQHVLRDGTLRRMV
ncbi:cytochrome b [Pseudooceanicola sp. CBS1P-1]|uniref:Cytochrome b n=1 Tax=Pseudooceanicola albus TaxID=2692189 RepID=A0A6L7G3Z4_9RHOB|nr:MULTISPECIES: cytochrome b [Pseudooceanicola]MBT9383497.1 cytochrome b [Pseudooceanicola endophyticus]MXN17353.1 cytochrome b [Pseudooceanicola albus]